MNVDTWFWGLSAFYLFFAAVSIARSTLDTPAQGARRVAVQFMAAIGYGAIWPVIALLQDETE